MNKELLPPLKRIAVACIVLGAGWVLFMQIAPRFMRSPPPAVVTLPAPAPQPVPIATEPAAPPTPPPTPAAQESLPPVDATEPLQAKLVAQDKLIAELRQQQQQSQHTLARWEAYDHLKERVLSGQAYTAELQALRALAQGDAPLENALSALQAAAATGIPSRETLTRRFAPAAKAALHPPLAPDATLGERFRNNAAKWVYIRRVGDVPGDTPDAIIARAEMALDRQNVAQATAELSHLTDAAAEAVQPWLAQAKAYLSRDAALANIRGALCCG